MSDTVDVDRTFGPAVVGPGTTGQGGLDEDLAYDPKCVVHPDCPLRADAHEDGDDLSACQPIPGDPGMLPRRDFGYLYTDERTAWEDMSDDQRARILIRVRRRADDAEQRAARQRERDQVCAEYVMALTAVGTLKGEEREAAVARLDSARTAWHAIRRRRR